MRDEPRTVTAPVSGKRVRIPSATGVLNGNGVDFFNLSVAVLNALDVQLTGIDFGFVTLKIAHGRVAAFDAMRSTKVLDELVGQQPPKRNVA